MAALLAITLAAAMAARAAADDATALAGIWTLDTRASDDPVRVLRDGDHGDGIGRRVARGVSIFGIPVGSLPRSAGDEPVEPDEDLRGVEHVFESTHRLSIEQQTEATQIRYGNALAIDYRGGQRVEHEGAVTTAEWQDGVLTVEHELADGTRVSERYSYHTRADELHWTVRLKRRKTSAVEIERVFYRVVGAAVP